MVEPPAPGFEDQVAPYRRSSARVPLEIEVSFHSESQLFVGLSGDISQGGIFVSTYKLLPIGTPVTLTFSLPNGQVDAVGVVRWARPITEGGEPPGLGIAFDGLAGDAKAVIERFCSARPPLYIDLDD